MNTKWMLAGLMAILMVMLAACGSGNKTIEPTGASGSSQTEQSQSEQANTSSQNESGADEGGETRTIEYLGQTYTIPAKVQKLVIAGAMEAMEDAAALGVHPAGAISVGGSFPEMFAAITADAVSIGEKQQPNFETILGLKPDVILGSTKFTAEVQEKLRKIAPTILVSHIATDWEANLRLMGELGSKQQEAEAILAQYKQDAEAMQASIKEKLQGKRVAAVRIRGTQMYVYPPDVYFNPVLYDEIGLEVPAQVAAAKTQEAISVEQLAEMNPDYLFIQFATSESGETEQAYNGLKNNAIIQNITAFKQDQVYVNVVDPLLEGGPAFSRIKFLASLQQHLDK
ncbi:ABC transporter substrate-binding protein [Paenibacillus sp. SYP-B4298]|uniref:ABC transporter substrate-binding protein n=1 Tax=Paenibacillus sp. SYP-B4298 TaxID=2996034 RepID=UPI0022DD57EF|nr:ABC transporter substrate-binding protein [Paenibacillus sp. SYP-B4298]